MMDRSKESDHVVREISVYLSKTLADKLLLVQYPQRPATVSMDRFTILNPKIKPLQNKIQISLELDQDSETYDPESAELLAEAAEGVGLNEDEYMPDRRLRIEKTTMESSLIPKLTNSSRYVIGIIRGGQVTLNPVKSILQMKTTFPYLNKAEKARTAYQKEQAGGDTEDETEEPEATKVTVKFSRNTASSGDKLPSRVSSYSAREKAEEEPWSDLVYLAKNPQEYEKLYSANTEADTPFYILPRDNYLQLLFPKHSEVSIEGGTVKKSSNPKMSIQQMRNMTVPEQLKVLLSNAKVLQYYQVVEFLKTKLKSETDDTSMLRTIQTVGILVQGCWVVRSDIVYPDDFKSGTNSIAGPVMQRARDLILYQFTEQRFVERRRMIVLTRLPAEEVTEILSQVSKMIPKKGWEFALPYDADFISRFPDVVHRQSLIWEMKSQQRTRKISSSSESKDKDSRPSTGSPPRRRSRNTSFSSDTDSGSESPRRRRGSGSRPRRRNSSRSNEIGIPTKVEM